MAAQYSIPIHINGAMRLMVVSQDGYNNVMRFLAMTEEFIAYYKAHETEEDVIDHTYQLMQRTLYTLYKTTFIENKVNLKICIGFTKQYYPDSKMITEYYEYIIYCLEKEEQKRAEELQCVLKQHYM